MFKKILLNSIENLGGFSLSRFFTRHKPMILMYHRVIRHPMIPGVYPDVFEQQLIYLKQHFNVMNMKAYMAAQSANKLPANSIVLTFDDGHKDFYTAAWPLIKKHNLTASLFISTGFVDKLCWLWPDLLRYILITTPETEFHIPPLGHLALKADNILKTWNSLGDYCLTLEASHRLQFIQDLAQQLKVTAPEAPVEPFSPVSWDDLREMQQQGLDVGSHSVNHPILSAITSAQLEEELTESKNRIIKELGLAPQGICYPNGMAKDTSPQVEAVAQQYYDYGLVAYPAKVNLMQKMHMGRMGSPNNLLEFKAKVNHLTHGNNYKGEYH